jgi:hypothetical protein
MKLVFQREGVLYMEWRRIDYLEHCETKEQALQTAKSIFNMYNEHETTFYNDLHCTEYKDNEKNKQVRETAKRHLNELKKFIKWAIMSK